VYSYRVAKRTESVEGKKAFAARQARGRGADDFKNDGNCETEGDDGAVIVVKFSIINFQSFIPRGSAAGFP
jgi:hypothetical protein